ncbi:hypothetical protein JPSP19_09010 [Staphylococcus pseudintermedius]
MKKVDQWLKQKRIHPQRFYGACFTIALVGILVVSYFVLRHSDDDHINLIEDAEIRTGPNAAYPVLYQVHKGDEFLQIGKQGK